MVPDTVFVNLRLVQLGNSADSLSGCSSYARSAASSLPAHHHHHHRHRITTIIDFIIVIVIFVSWKVHLVRATLPGIDEQLRHYPVHARHGWRSCS